MKYASRMERDSAIASNPDLALQEAKGRYERAKSAGRKRHWSSVIKKIIRFKRTGYAFRVRQRG